MPVIEGSLFAEYILSREFYQDLSMRLSLGKNNTFQDLIAVIKTWIKKDFLVKVYLNTIGHYIDIKAVTFFVSEGFENPGLHK